MTVWGLWCRLRGHKWGWQGYDMVWEADGGGYPLAVRCDRCGYFGTRERYPEPFVTGACLNHDPNTGPGSDYCVACGRYERVTP